MYIGILCGFVLRLEAFCIMMKHRLKIILSAALVWLLVCLGSVALAEGLSITGCAYVDDNHNTIRDSGEQLITGVPITLECLNGAVWKSAGEAVTDAYGAYAFQNLSQGRYRVSCLLGGQDLYAASMASSQQYRDGALVLEADLSSSFTADVGLRPAAKMQVKVFLDSNANGERGDYERALANVQVELLSPDGESVLTSGTTDAKGSVILSAAPGECLLRVTLADDCAFTVLGKHNCITSDGVTGTSDPITLVVGETVKASVGARPVGSFSGMAFEDMNNDGVMDDGEPGVEGVTVHLSGSRTGTVRSITTDATGVYHFQRLPDDLYTVSADLPEGMLYARYSKTGGDKRSIFTGSNLTREFSVKSGAPVADKNIGVVQKGVIHGKAFLDLNYNGLPDVDEPGYKGVTVEAIKLSNSTSYGKVVTGEDGLFRLENLRGGDYRLRAILPEDGSIFTVTAQGEPHEANLFEQRKSRRENSIQPLAIESGGEDSAVIGVALGASISGKVFQDADYNGRLNGKEKLLSGIKVQAVDAQGQVVATSVTGPKGQYVLNGLMPGSYIVQVQRKEGFGFTRLRPQEKEGSFVTHLEGSVGVTNPIAVSMGEAITGVNAGMLPSATVSGSLFHDENDNGLWDDGEGGMTTAEVRLLSEDGEIDLYCTPLADGSYFFDGVMPGKYTLSYHLPEHCEMAQVAKGGNTVKHTALITDGEPFSIKMGDAHTMPLAGAVTLGSFAGGVFHDANANGLCDPGESPLAGTSLSLTASGSKDVFEALTEADGAFMLSGLRPDDYTLTIELPDGYIFSRELGVDELRFENVSREKMGCPWDALTNRTEKAIGAVQPGSISGVIWMDEDRSSTRGETEWIMEGLTLLLISEEDGAVVDTVSSYAGGFLFENVRPGAYTVQFSLPNQSEPANDPTSTFALSGGLMQHKGVMVAEAETVRHLTTGLVSRTSIGGSLWLDEAGQRSPVSGVSVSLLQDGQVLKTIVTAEDGGYRFDGLWPDEYVIQASIPDGLIFVRPGDPNYGASIIQDTQSGLSHSIQLLMAQHQLHSDILYIKSAKVGDLAWLDENQNGLVDGSEPRLSGVVIALTQNGKAVYETTTDAYGYYLFPDVYPGEYVLKASAYPELVPTTPVKELRIISSCLTSGDGSAAFSDPFLIGSGESNANFDVGYVLRNGCTLPQGAVALDAPTRDWTLLNTIVK